MFRLPRIPEPHRGENFDWRLQSPGFYVTSNICNILYVRGFFVRISQDKQKKLAYVARRYYLEDQKQSDIARELGVSRPLVSRMLSEARELGIVEITIHEPGAKSASLLDRLRLSSSIRSGVLVEDGEDDDTTNQLLSQGAVDLLRRIGSHRLKLILYSSIFGSDQIEYQVRCRQTSADTDRHIEIYRSRSSVPVIHTGANTFRCFQAEKRIHHITPPVHIAATGQLKFFQRDNRQ